MPRYLAAAAIVAALCSSPVHAAWPDRPVTLVVPYPAGGNADTIGRFIAERLRQEIGGTIVVENKGGAGATIGARAVASAAPDGYTLLLAPTAVMAITHHLRDTPYSVADFAPVACVSGSYGIVAARANLPANTLAELIAMAKEKPDVLTYGSAGQATATHLSGVMVSQAAGMSLMHVPYKGSGEALNDLLGGQIDLIFDPVALTQVKAGRLKALAAISNERNPELPDVPTLAELGYDVDTRSWFGVFAPKGTPADIIDKVAKGIEAVLSTDETREALLKFSQYPLFRGPEAFGRQVAEDDAFFGNLIRQTGIKLQ